MHRLREGLDDKGLERMNQTIEEAGRVPHPWLAPAPNGAPGSGNRPPPGWKSDEENWRNIQGFLGSGLVKTAAGR